MIYAYANSEMTALQPGDSTSVLAEQMTMAEISHTEYADIDDITGYAIGTEDVSGSSTEARNQCKLIGNTHYIVCKNSTKRTDSHLPFSIKS